MNLEILPTDQLKNLQKEYSGNWVWRAVSSMVGAKGIPFNEPHWAKLLGVPLEEILLALHGLEKLGIIKRTEYGYEKILKFVYIKDEDMESKNLVGEHVLISTQILSRLRPFDEHQANFYRTSFLASNRSRVKKYCETMASALQELVQDSSGDECDGVYAISLSSLNILEKP